MKELGLCTRLETYIEDNGFTNEVIFQDFKLLEPKFELGYHEAKHQLGLEMTNFHLRK